MNRVIIYGHTEWSTGRLYFELCKRLYVYGVDSQFLDWVRGYSREELLEQNETTEYWISSPSGISKLHYEYGIPLNKCVVIVYHPIDIVMLQQANINVEELGKFVTISAWLLERCSCFSRKPELLFLGINTHAFYCSPPKQLKTLGFASAFLTREQTQDWKNSGSPEPASFKRGYLVKEVAEILGLTFKNAQWNRNTYRTIPGFYNSVDCVICASEDEGAGGPVLEGGAAGRLIITTNIGAFNDIVTNKGADAVPVAENEFIEQTVNLLRKYINDPDLFYKRCCEIQEYALKAYDWDCYIESWVRLLHK